MSANSNFSQDDEVPLLPDDEPLPLEVDDAEPQPVPVPVPAPVKSGEPQSAKIDFAHREEVSVEKISIVEEVGSNTAKKSKAFGTASMSEGHKKDYKRPLNNDGKGATRCRVFHSKIQENPLLHMETVINDWVDEEGIEIKHIAQCIGIMEGKRAEPNLLVTVWY